jgi:hypothetical protein
MDEEPDVRRAVTNLLTAWETGAREPRRVFEDARALWLSRRWPQAHEKGFDPAAVTGTLAARLSLGRRLRVPLSEAGEQCASGHAAKNKATAAAMRVRIANNP